MRKILLGIKVTEKLTIEELEEIAKDSKLINWELISAYKCLSEEFIREFKTKISWINVSYNQNLSEEFITEFKDFVYWPGISCYQNLSKEFCLEFYDRIDWKQLFYNKSFSKEYFDSAPRHVKLYITLNYRDLIKWIHLLKENV